MKNSILLIFVMLILACEKLQPSAPIPTYSITFTITGSGKAVSNKLIEISFGSNVDLKFTPDSGFSLYSVKINGDNIQDIQPSSTEVTYTIREIKKNLNVEVTFIETGLLIVSVKSTQEQPWKWTKLDIYKASDNTFIRPSALTQAEKDRRYYFIYPSMELIVLNPDNSRYFTGTWDLKQNVFHRASEVMSVWEISKTKLVVTAKPIWSSADNCYAYAVYTYERKTN